MRGNGRDGGRTCVRSDDVAIGEAAQSLRRGLERIPESRSSLGSVAFALAELDLAAEEARDDGWDGYEGVALDRRSYDRARAILLRFPSRLPAPEVAADPRGGVALSWQPGPGVGFLVSIRPPNRFTYAGIRDGISVHGLEIGMDELPPPVLYELERLIGLTVSAT